MNDPSSTRRVTAAAAPTTGAPATNSSQSPAATLGARSRCPSAPVRPTSSALPLLQGIEYCSSGSGRGGSKRISRPSSGSSYKKGAKTYWRFSVVLDPEPLQPEPGVQAAGGGVRAANALASADAARRRRSESGTLTSGVAARGPTRARPPPHERRWASTAARPGGGVSVSSPPQPSLAAPRAADDLVDDPDQSRPSRHASRSRHHCSRHSFAFMGDAECRERSTDGEKGRPRTPTAHAMSLRAGRSSPGALSCSSSFSSAQALGLRPSTPTPAPPREQSTTKTAVPVSPLGDDAPEMTASLNVAAPMPLTGLRLRSDDDRYHYTGEGGGGGGGLGAREAALSPGSRHDPTSASASANSCPSSHTGTAVFRSASTHHLSVSAGSGGGGGNASARNSATGGGRSVRGSSFTLSNSSSGANAMSASNCNSHSQSNSNSNNSNNGASKGCASQGGGAGSAGGPQAFPGKDASFNSGSLNSSGNNNNGCSTNSMSTPFSPNGNSIRSFDAMALQTPLPVNSAFIMRQCNFRSIIFDRAGPAGNGVSNTSCAGSSSSRTASSERRSHNSSSIGPMTLSSAGTSAAGMDDVPLAKALAASPHSKNSSGADTVAPLPPAPPQNPTVLAGSVAGRRRSFGASHSSNTASTTLPYTATTPSASASASSASNAPPGGSGSSSSSTPTPGSAATPGSRSPARTPPPDAAATAAVADRSA